jgi:hypothetical protein
LTTGDLQETSVILGTDEHNVRTKINGSVELTSADYDNQNTYRLNFKNNVLRISSTAEPDEEDLFIKAEDDLYLDALGDDVFVRANDDIRLRTGYDFESSDYNWQFRFTNSGEQIIYNDQDGSDYGRITPNLFDEGVRGLTLEGENQLRLRVASGNELILNSDGDLIFPDNTVQTTAWNPDNTDWAGIVGTTIQTNGLPVGTRFTQSAPSSSIGQIGDTVGTVAFDGSYVYYCTDSYVPNTFTTTIASPGLSIDTIPVTKGDYPTPEIGWIVTIIDTDYTITAIEDGDTSWILTANSNLTGGTGTTVTLSTGVSLPNIWRRLAWSNDTW